MHDDWLKLILLYIPLSFIGAWRWSYWLVRRLGAAMYRPHLPPLAPGQGRPTVSLVTPVYNEDPAVFAEAMQSWIGNGVDEIIAVIDKSNTHHLVNFERTYRRNPAIDTKCRMIVTPKPGKRAALCDGIEAANGDLIVLVDSDTIWGEDVLEKTLPYFADPKIGGATVAQRISNPNNISNVMFDILLWTRYQEEVPFLLGVGRAFNTLSGRTAFYRREALLNPQYDNLHSLRHEFFLGTRGISGDDKRLTHLILQQGWNTAFVKGATVYTPGLGSIRKFLKQRLRWTRNSWRADLRAVGRGWVWRHPALAIFMIDRFFQPIFMLIGPIVLVISIINNEWLFVGILLAWWLVSRSIRLFGYFRAAPRRLIYLPAYIIYGYVNAIIKIYALGSLIENSWATRWHKSRTKRKNIFRKSFPVTTGSLGIASFVFAVTQIVLAIRSTTGVDIPPQPAVDQVAVRAAYASLPQAQAVPRLPAAPVNPQTVSRYVLQNGDYIDRLSIQFGMSVSDLKKLNGIRDADKVSVGQEIVYYPGSIK